MEYLGFYWSDFDKLGLVGKLTTSARIVSIDNIGRANIRISAIRPVKTDFMFYISSHVRFSPKSGKICTNFYFAIFLAVFQFSKFLIEYVINFCVVLLIF